MAAAVSLLFVISVTGFATLTFTYFRSEFTKSIFRQQYALTSSMADHIDERLSVSLRALKAAASRVPLNAVSDPAVAQRFLDERVGLLSLFDNGIFIVATDGTLIAESPSRFRRGHSVAHQNFYQDAVRLQTPFISQPYISSHTPGHPAVVAAVPLLDASGKMTGMITGSLDLTGKNLLQELAKAQIGQTGYFYLFNTDGVMIMHPDRGRIMKKIGPSGMNLLFDRALNGFNGSGETVNSRGIPMVCSFKHLRSTSWVLAANYPTDEAFAPIRRAFRYFIAFTIAGTMGTLVIAWLLMKRLTSPLVAVTRHVASLSQTPEGLQPLVLKTGDEIETLADAFNGMAEALEMRRRALAESEANFRALADNANDGLIIITGEGKFSYANLRASKIAGYSIPELLRMSVPDLVTPEEAEAMMKRTRSIIAGEKVPRQYETVVVNSRQERLPVEITSARTVWQGEPADLIVVRDIAERKEAEARIRSALQEKEVLLKEIHHRVKNNLQVISSLLQLQASHIPDERSRELFRESQNRVRSMALVHERLYRAQDFAAVDFAEYVKSLSGHLFHTYAVNPGQVALEVDVCDARLTVDTAIPCGFILNELITNAFKYAFPGDRRGTVTIRLTQEDDSFILTISDNGVGLPPDFDPAQSRSLGLQLVSMLTQQLRGTLRVEREGGSSFEMRFPAPRPEISALSDNSPA